MIQGVTTGIIEQKIGSMQMQNTTIEAAKKGMNIAIKLNSKVRKNDKVYLVSHV
jgi:hypothetical protein